MTVGNKDANGNVIPESIVSYITGQDSQGYYTTTFFSIKDDTTGVTTIYQIKNYDDSRNDSTAAKETVLTNYSGDPQDEVEAIVGGTTEKISVQDLANRGNKTLDYYLSNPFDGRAYNS